MTETALRLPPALAVWGELFTDMPEGNLRLLAALVSEISPLVDKAEAVEMRPRGEVDSFSGIGTRGGVDRLLASEWLWRDLAPDEFLRRVAEREALTFEPVHRQAADARTVLVVIDAGPAMLGRPRLVAFAALLCLAASAKVRGARLLWSSNAMPVPAWREALTREEVAMLLDLVSPTTLAADEVEHLLSASLLPTPRRQKLPPMLWLVGGPGLPEVASPASCIAILERPRVDASSFTVAARVDVTAANGRTASAIFDLPDEAEATALLRQPFRAVKVRPEPRKSQPQTRTARPGWAQTSIAFASDAAYLVIALRDGLLFVPTEPNRPVLRAHLARYERLIGFEINDHKLAMATATRYTERARIVLREADLRDGKCSFEQLFAVGVPHNHPLIEQPWPRNALPFIGRPGKRARFWTLASNGAPYAVTADEAKPFLPLSSGTILKVCDQAILIRKPSGEIVASARASGRTLARFRVPQSMVDGAKTVDFLEQEEGGWLVIHRADGGWHLSVGDEGEALNLSETQGGDRIVAFVGNRSSGDRPLATTLDAAGRVCFRDDDWQQICNIVKLDVADPPLILAAAQDDEPPFLVAAGLDSDGYVDRFGLADTGQQRWLEQDVLGATIEVSTCLTD